MQAQGFTIVTGASSGIGLEMAKALAEQARPLVLVARREEVLTQLAQEWKTKFGVQIKVVAADLTVASEVEKVLDAVKDLPLNGLINNAGFGFLGEFTKCPWPLYQQLIALNISALVRLTYGVLPKLMAQKSGEIMNVCSTAGLQPGPFLNVYSASKAFALSFSQALAEELRGTGVTVTALCPGPTTSEFHARAGTDKASRALTIIMASARDVALFGLKAMRRGRVVAVPGVSNHIVAFTSRYFPKPIVARIASRILRPRAEG